MVAMGTEVAGGVTDTDSPHFERVSVSTARTFSFAPYRVTAEQTKEVGRYGADVDTYNVCLPFLPNTTERGADRPPDTPTTRVPFTVVGLVSLSGTEAVATAPNWLTIWPYVRDK